jgi:precorrin-8X/cobalt-precorrin-8 methylmutase
MPLFDRYIAVDWSAANTPRKGKDSIWIADSEAESVNPSTRHEAMAILTDRLIARPAGQRVMLGFDFVFGYPEGAAEAIVAVFPELPTNATRTAPLAGLRAVPQAESLQWGDSRGEGLESYARTAVAQLGGLPPSEAGRGGWSDLWAILRHLVIDNPDNSSNRFDVAAAINARLAAPHYWGHPHQHRYDNLHPRRPAAYASIPERRRAEVLARTAQPVWKLTGAGSVGSQAMLGIARLEALRHHPVLGPDIAIWPFETAFADALKRPIAITEIYPSLFPLDDPSVTPKDRGQVETCVHRFAALDAAGELRSYLSGPTNLSTAERDIILREEGWIVGIGHPSVTRQAA